MTALAVAQPRDSGLHRTEDVVTPAANSRVRLARAEAAQLDAVRRLTDPRERAEAAAALVRQARAKADAARSRRDVAALVLIEPYEAAQRPYKRVKDQVDAQLEAGDIDYPEANARLAEAKAERAKAMEGVTYTPVDVYRDILGVSRGLFVRMTQRAPEQLPDIPDAEQVATKAANDVDRYDALAAEALRIRNEVTDDLLNGLTGPAMRNADIARMTGLTTARVAQLRLGTR